MHLPAPSSALSPAEETLMRGHPWFAACAPQLQEQLLRAGRRVSLGAGQALFERGDRPEGLCCVLSGALQVGAAQADGRPSLLAWLEPGQWFGEISLLDGRPRTHDAVAEGASQVWLVPHTGLQAWLDQHPACWRDLAVLACTKLRLSFEVLEDIARLPLPQRLAKRLLLLDQGYGQRAPGGTPRPLRLPQEQLALMLGVSRQSVSKALQALAAQGLLALGYGEIELLDRAALQALGEAAGEGA
ncbi:Crp/Fnr family transcriptional regulator [Kinneretia asaccharophila]|uniref:Crp/Fnr family transcriptional regulator n=1 Tax=Roseateles asaccharophilus TaxID=582607 RepID=A0A4R6MZ30_9BURK|nr:Crp/Fnr family transcriptional regulator [Roseateles asaccharophilus]MDN3545534.1 Crp/Fnr family transcriptional regulator [Roseateles asaccharophilus]TDP07914.1 Crp/Fnr family transcriptional regulator [Roseateles asaccharophilus]